MAAARKGTETGLQSGKLLYASDAKPNPVSEHL